MCCVEITVVLAKRRLILGTLCREEFDPLANVENWGEVGEDVIFQSPQDKRTRYRTDEDIRESTIFG